MLVFTGVFQTKAETLPRFTSTSFGNKYANTWGVPYRTLSISKAGVWFMPTSNGLWKSTNSGRSWSLSSFEGHECMAVFASATVLLASVHRPGINRLSDLYYSNDMGKHWSKSKTPFDKANGGIWVSMFAEFQDTLFAVTYHQFSTKDTTFLCYSTNKGQSWDTFDSFTTYQAYPHFDFTQNEILLTYRYIPLANGGETIIPIVRQNGVWMELPVFPYRLYSDRGVARVTPWKTIMLNTEQGLFELRGNEWVQNTGVTGIGRTFAFDRKGRIFCAWQENYYYEDVDTTGGLMISADSGRTWRQAASPLGGQLRTITFSGDTVIGFTSKGWIIRSTNDGDTWQRADTGIVSYPVIHITFGGGSVYTAGWRGTGLWRGPEDGKSGKWSYLGCEEGSVKTIAVSNRGTVFAVWEYPLLGERGTMQELRRISADGKAVKIEPNFGGGPIKLYAHPNGDMFVNPSNPRMFGLFRTTDDGDSWIQVDSVATDDYCVLKDSTIIIGYGDVQGYLYVKVSHDYGRTWSSVKFGDEMRILKISYMGYIHGRVFLYASRMASIDKSTLLYSDDRGHTWQKSNDGSEKYLQLLAADSTGRIFAAGGGFTLYVSNDKGITWQALDSASQILGGNASVYSLATSPRGYIYVGTYYNGLYRSTERYPPVGVIEEPLPTTQELHIIPNPANGTLRWNIPDGTATIINVMGQKMMELPASAQTADVSGLAAGVYVLTVRTAAGIVSRTFVKE